MRAVVLSVVLAGCSFPTKPGDPFACNNAPLPTTAPEMINVHGIVSNPFGGDKPVPNAQITGYVVADGTNVMTLTATSDENGAFAGSETTVGAPHSQFLTSITDGFVETIEYPAVDVANDIEVEVKQTDSTGFGELLSLAGADQSLPVMIIAVVDCNDQPVAGATVSASVTGSTQPTVIYLGADGTPDVTAAMTGDSTGAAFVSNIPITTVPSTSAVTISANLEGVTFQSHVVTATLGALTLAEVSP